MAPTRMHVNSDSSLLDDVFVLLALGLPIHQRPNRDIE